VLTPQVANPPRQLFFMVLQVITDLLWATASLTTQTLNKSVICGF
jgi:hypothetical protein